MNRKKYEFIEKFPSISLFIEYLISKKIRLSYENKLITEKITKVYNNFSNNDGKITDTDFNNYFYNAFGLKDRSCLSAKGLLERGFDKEYIKNKITETNKKAMFTINSKEKLFNNEYIFNKYSFMCEDEPKCNICGSELDLVYIPKYKVKSIYKCKNLDCESKRGLKNKYRAFLPKEIYDVLTEKRKEYSYLNNTYWIKKGYTEDEAKFKISAIQKINNKKVKNKVKIDKAFIKNKYKLTDEGLSDFFSIKTILSVKYWEQKGVSKTDAIDIIKRIQTNNALMYVKKFKVNPDKYYKTMILRKEYWKERGYSEEDSKNEISKIQSRFSLSKCIEKYGELQGEIIWAKRQVKWQLSLHKNGNLHVGYSKVSQRLFNDILNYYNKPDRDYIFFGEKNHEFSINDGKLFIYDFCDLKNRKIIEFNGDIYHGNPKIYKEDDRPNPYKKNKTAKDLWAFDKEKEAIAINNNFEVLTIWEQEYKDNRQFITDNCKKFLNL